MSEQRLSLQDVARYPRPGLSIPRHVEFTPDSQGVAYLASPDGTLVQELWVYDSASGERRRIGGAAAGGAISREEELRRERSRLRETGITDFAFARAGDDGPTVLLVPQQGRL